MKRLIFLSLLIATTSIGCPSKNEKALAPGVHPEDLKAGAINQELDFALNSVLSLDQASPQQAACPESLVDGLDENLRTFLECGALRVPEFHDRKTNQNLSLAYVRIQKDKSVQKPLLVIEQGGPGSSSMALAAYHLRKVPALADAFDILAVEQRGTPWTRPNALCKETTEYSLKMIDGDEDEDEKNSILKTCVERISKELDIDSISTFQIASDLVFASKTFGHSKFSYYGVSYGTLVGQYLLKFYAQSVDRVILDSPVIPGRDWLADAISNFDSVMRMNLSNYRVQNSSWDKTPEVSVQYLNSIARQYDQEPMRLKFVHDGKNYEYSFRGEHFRGLAFKLTTSSYNPEYLTYLINAAENRKAVPTESQRMMEVLVQAFFEADSSETDLMYQALICREFEQDQIGSEKIPPSWKLIPLLYAGSDELEEDLSFERCGLGLEKGSQEKVLKGPVESNGKVLVVGGSTDHVTSPKYVAAVASKFTRGHQAIFEAVGHGVLGEKPCINDSLLSFLKSESGDFRNLCLP